MPRASSQFGCDVLLVGEQTAHVVRQASLLIRRGLRVACLNGKRLQETLAKESGIHIDNHPFPPTTLKGRYRFPWLHRLEAQLDVRRLRRLIGNIRPGLIHINFVDPKHVPFCGLGPEGPPIISTVWGSDLHTFAQDGNTQQRESIIRLLESSTYIIVDAPHMIDLLRDTVPQYESKRVEIVYFGVDVDAFSNASLDSDKKRVRRSMSIPDGAKILLAPRRMGPKYFPERILHGFAQAAVSREAFLVFKLFGDRPHEEPGRQKALQELARSLKIDDQVRFAPPCPYGELPALYQAADAACFMLDRDGTPSTALELWAAGTPVIASDIPYYKGVLEHNRNSILLPPHDTQLLANAIDDVLMNPQRYQPLVESARKWVRQFGDAKDLADNLLRVYLKAGLPAAACRLS